MTSPVFARRCWHISSKKRRGWIASTAIAAPTVHGDGCGNTASHCGAPMAAPIGWSALPPTSPRSGRASLICRPHAPRPSGRGSTCRRCSTTCATASVRQWRTAPTSPPTRRCSCRLTSRAKPSSRSAPCRASGAINTSMRWCRGSPPTPTSMSPRSLRCSTVPMAVSRCGSGPMVPGSNAASNACRMAAGWWWCATSPN